MEISILSAGGSLLTWFAYGRKLHRQEIRPNEYLINEQQREENSKHKAEIRVTAQFLGKGMGGILTIANEGQAPATNIRIESQCLR